MNTLFESAPDFSQPLAVLKHCHGRIRKQLSTMQKLVQHLQSVGLTADAQQAATAVLRYFDHAAPNHHADEEQDLLPMLLSSAIDEDLVLLNITAAEVIDEHRHMDQIWQLLAVQLRAIAIAEAAELSAGNVHLFVKLYNAHMEKEEAIVTPMAQRLFDQEQMAQLGDAMRLRRGIAA